jgi:hypothetical protein
MWIVKEESIKPSKKRLVENNEYIIYIDYVEEEEIAGKILTRSKTEMRFCKANKKGNIKVSFKGQKLKYNINDILE